MSWLFGAALFIFGNVCLTCCLASSVLPDIALATVITVAPEGNTSNIDALQIQGPGIDVGLSYLLATYGDTFNFSHVYLTDKTRPTIPLLWDDRANFVAQFFYKNIQQSAGLALLSPGELQ